MNVASRCLMFVSVCVAVHCGFPTPSLAAEARSWKYLQRTVRGGAAQH